MSKPITRSQLLLIGKYVLDGMSEKESCILSEVSHSDLQKLKESNDDVFDYLEQKKVQFKYNHLKEIQTKRSEKNSQWILEKLRPEEFGTKAKGGEAPTINIISQIIKQIQNDNDPIIDITRGSRVKANEEEGEDGTVKRLTVASVLE